MAQVVLRLEEKGRLEVGGERRDVEQRAEPLVEEPPTQRAAVVVTGIVRRAQRSQRALDEPSARIDLDRLEPGGQIDDKAVFGGRVVPAQALGDVRAIDDGDLHRLADQFPFAANLDLHVVAAGRPGRHAHRLEAVVHARQRAQPLPPEPFEVGAEGLGGGAPQRYPLVERLVRQRGESRPADEIEQLAVDEAGAGRRGIGEQADVVANAILVLHVTEVGRRRGEQRRVDELIDGGDEVERPQQVGRVLQLLVLNERVELRQIGAEDAGGQVAIGRRLRGADAGVDHRGEDGARQLLVVVLAQRLDREDAEDLIGDEDDVAVRLHQLVAQRRLDQRDRQGERRIGRAAAAAGSSDGPQPTPQSMASASCSARSAVLRTSAGHVLAHVGERLVLAAGRTRVAMQVTDDVLARRDGVGPQHAIGDDRWRRVGRRSRR